MCLSCVCVCVRACVRARVCWSICATCARAGTLPNSIGYLQQIQYLDLSSNHLQGDIPASIITAGPPLQQFYVNNNCLAAPTPAFVNFCDVELLDSCNWMPQGVQAQCPVPSASDLEALCDLFQATLGSGWSEQLGWPAAPSACATSASSFCTWYGVTCDAGLKRAVGLNLAQNSLGGTLSASIGLLTALNVLNISGNSVGGAIPGSIGACASLERLDVSHNALNEVLPPGIGAARSLTHLILNNNKLGSTLPASIANMSSLRVLEAQSNSLKGAVPPMGGLPGLAYVDLSQNMLTGVLPGGAWKNLSVLILRSNMLSGLSGDCLFPALQYLDVSENWIDGVSPAAPFLGWPALFYMDLSFNLLSAFPVDICPWVQNVRERLYTSGACGPKQLEACGAYLSIYGNIAAGRLPACVGTRARAEALFRVARARI